MKINIFVEIDALLQRAVQGMKIEFCGATIKSQLIASNLFSVNAAWRFLYLECI